MVEPANLVVIMSDEHSRKVLGCYGNDVIKTPNLDKLAKNGVRFSNAYCNSPICVPSRASFATGRYVHDVRFWDNALAYDGSVPSWGHRLIEAGHECVSIGKLHYASGRNDNGFEPEIIPLHIVNGTGDPLGLLRDPLPIREASLVLAEEAGRGDSSYQRYDDKITLEAQEWLKKRANRSEKPWVLFVSLICPHFPLISRREYYDMYPLDQVPWPQMFDDRERSNHPYIKATRDCMIFEQGFKDEESVRRAIAAYYGMVTFTDENVGKILRTLESSGLSDSTRVIYTSDHGDNLGNRGMWGKSTLYEESVGVPLIMAGPGIEAGAVCEEPVSLVDCFPTILDCAGVERVAADRSLPGSSLFDVANGLVSSRTVCSEYHAAAGATGAFMVRKGRYKYIYYAGMPAMLFDLEADPQERSDIGQDLAHQHVVREFEGLLRLIVDPDAADAQAKADQRERIAELGGRDAIMRMGAFSHSPTPYEDAVYHKAK